MTHVDLTELVREINAAIDSGCHVRITMENMRDWIERRSVFVNMKNSVDSSFGTLMSAPSAMAEVEERLLDICLAHRGREGKWGVENSGLCLLLAWVNEILQQELTRHVSRATIMKSQLHDA